MVYAIRIHETGGPEVLKWESFEPGQPGPKQLLLRQTDIGVNFIDIYHRSGLYPMPLPFIPGMDGAGIVEAVGSEVTRFKVGDRVAYSGALGAYAEARLLEEHQAVALPAGISNRVAAGSLLRGLTVDYMMRLVYPVQKGETILIHAAAGGVGLIFSQWAAAIGATVIGTVSTEAKAELARRHGCHHIILAQEDLPARVLEITDGKKLPVVYDSIGADTFDASLQCLAPFGLLVSYGNASGPVPPFSIARLSAGSLKVTRASASTAATDPARYQAVAAELFGLIGDGTITPVIGEGWPLREAAAAQIAMAGRKTVGSTVLTV